MENKVTITDIASVVGVSIGTVHRALHGKAGVSTAVRNEILRQAEEMGYCAPATTALQKKGPLRLVVAFPELTRENSYFFSELWRGYREQMKELAAYHIEVLELPYDDSGENGFSANMQKAFRKWNGEIDGVLAGGRIFADGYEELRRMHKRNIPIVLVGEGAAACGGLCCIQSDYELNGRLAAEALTAQIPPDGKILMCAGDMLLRSNHNSEVGFEKYLRANGCKNLLIKIHGYEGVDGIYESVTGALAADKNIVGLYSVNLRCSLMLARAVEAMGLQQRVCLIGSDLCPESAVYLRSGTINNIIFKNPRMEGRIGAKRLTDYLLHGKLPATKTEALKTEVIYKSNLEQYL